VLQPSSLVFVGIIVGWAAYLLPQWVRRRETLSQSRGRDRDSSGLRLLHRRGRTAGGPSTAPILPEPGTALALDDPDDQAPAGDPAHRPDRHRPDGVSPAGRGGRTPGVLAEATREAARRRARVLTALVLLTATAWALAAVVPALAFAGWLCLLLLGLDLAALVVTGRQRAVRRAAAERERARRAEHARAEAQRRRTARAAAAARPVPQAAVSEPPAARTTPVPVVRPEPAAQRVARELGEGPPSETWTPVPVPPPTYTLKATAPRPEPAPLDLPADPPPQPAEPAPAQEPEQQEEATAQARPWEGDRSFADDLDLDAVLARRRAVNG